MSSGKHETRPRAEVATLESDVCIQVNDNFIIKHHTRLSLHTSTRVYEERGTFLPFPRVVQDPRSNLLTNYFNIAIYN